MTTLRFPGFIADVTFLTTPARGFHTHAIEIRCARCGPLEAPCGLTDLTTAQLVHLSKAVRAARPFLTVSP